MWEKENERGKGYFASFYDERVHLRKSLVCAVFWELDTLFENLTDSNTRLAASGTCQCDDIDPVVIVVLYKCGGVMMVSSMILIGCVIFVGEELGDELWRDEKGLVLFVGCLFFFKSACHRNMNYFKMSHMWWQ